MKKSLIQNITLNFIMKVIIYIFSFFTVMYITRIFSPDIYGKLSFSNSVIGIFLMISNLGMPIYAMRACAQHRDNRKELSKVFNELLSISFVLSLISIIILMILIFTIPKFIQNSTILIIYGGSIIFQMIGCEWLYKGLEKFKLLTVAMLIFRIISLIGIILFVHSENDILIYVLFSILATYGVNIICFARLRKYVDISFKLSIKKEHFKPLIVFFLMSCAVSIYSNLDIVILGMIKGDYITGLYGIVSKLKSVLAIVGTIFWTAILPNATQLWKEKKNLQFESLAKKTMFVVFIIQLFVTIGCLIFAKEIIFITGGETYLEAVNSFKIIILSLIPIGFSNILGGQVLIPAGHEKKLLKAELFGAVFNLISNLIVIPFFSIEGAALTTVISEIIVWIMCIYYIKKEINMDFSFIISKKIYRVIKEKIKILKIHIEDKLLRNTYTYYCPCCNIKLKRFYKGNFIKDNKHYDIKRYENIDQNVICPICYSLPRHRIIVEWLENNIDEIKNKTILHFAQEKSIRLWLERNNIKFITADLNNQADLTIDIENTKLEEKSVDMIICNHVLEHVSNYEKTIKELKRIIKTNGIIIISFPIDMSYEDVFEDEAIKDDESRVKYFGQFDHRRIFGKNSAQIFEKYGFKVETVCGNDCDKKIKPVIGPADYDSNIVFVLRF